MKTYGQFCPVAKTAEIFAERWTPLILRELCFGPRRFNQLRSGLPLISRTLLSRRLCELERSSVIESTPRPCGSGNIYRLTEAGQKFRPIIELMGAWGQQWNPTEIGPDDLDPGFLMWSMRRQISADLLPDRKFVIQFEFVGVPRHHLSQRYWWLVLHRSESDVCQKNPGHVIDIVIHTELSAFTKLWLGKIGLEQARAVNSVRLCGNEEAQAVTKRALGLSEQPERKAFTFGA